MPVSFKQKTVKKPNRRRLIKWIVRLRQTRTYLNFTLEGSKDHVKDLKAQNEKQTKNYNSALNLLKHAGIDLAKKEDEIKELKETLASAGVGEKADPHLAAVQIKETHDMVTKLCKLEEQSGPPKTDTTLNETLVAMETKLDTLLEGKSVADELLGPDKITFDMLESVEAKLDTLLEDWKPKVGEVNMPTMIKEIWEEVTDNTLLNGWNHILQNGKLEFQVNSKNVIQGSAPTGWGDIRLVDSYGNLITSTSVSLASSVGSYDMELWK